MLVVSVLLAMVATPLVARAIAMNRGAFDDVYTDNDGALAAIIAFLATAATTATGVFVVDPILGVEAVTAVAMVVLSMLWAVLIGRRAGARGRHWLNWLKRAAG